MASALARAGARVVLIARDPARLDAAVSGLRAAAARPPGSARTWPTGRAAGRAADEAAAAFGPPDILVNCAGINLRPPLAALTAATGT
jgi:NAD(P)-dependent dehydrogenase (short-subunit alcohol dehydrogenase family)